MHEAKLQPDSNDARQGPGGTAKGSRIIDLSTMPSGERYEDRYGAYLEIFRIAAESEEQVKIHNPPWCWTPLLWYLDVNFEMGHFHFPVDAVAEFAARRFLGIVSSDYMQQRTTLDIRATLESLCTFRPETVEALWKVQMQWKLSKRVQDHIAKFHREGEFVVTNSNGHFCPEVMHYLTKVLPAYTPTKKKVILAPCSADKPYPSKLHQEIFKRMPDDYYLCIHSGVIGLCPQDLWPQMPLYDAGIPNQWRLMEEASKYFCAHLHDRIVFYGDFYSTAVAKGLGAIGEMCVFVNPLNEYADYANLLDPERLTKLEKALK